MNNLTTLQNVFPEMTTFEWLERAYRNARKAKRYRDEILKFSSNLDSNLLRIQKEMLDGTFRFEAYRRHWIYVPKKRIVMALPFYSRIVQWSIYQELMPFYDRFMIEDSYACRKEKGSLAAVTRVQYWMQLIASKRNKWYALKLDISKYFYRVDHAILMDILRVRIKDERLLHLIDIIINTEGEKFGLPRFMGPTEAEDSDWLADVGMPIGNLTSQLFANIYLNELDQFCKHVLHVHFYARYMDDIILFLPSKAVANYCKAEIAKFLLERLHLDLNSKTAIRPADRVEFVGYVITAHSLCLRKDTTRRIKASFRGICRKYFTGELSKEEFDRRVASYKGMIQYCDSVGLRARLNEIYLHAKKAAAINEEAQICSK